MRVKVALVMLMVFLGFGTGVRVARATDLAQIYPTLVRQNPVFIQQLTSANPGDTQVLTELQSFVYALSADLAADQGLTRANFDTEAEAYSFTILISSNAYDDLHKAIAKAFPGLSLSSLLSGNIPAFLQPIASVVEDALLPPAVPAGGGGPAPLANPTAEQGLSSLSLTSQNIGRFVSGGVATAVFPAKATPPYFFDLGGGLLAANGIKELDVDFGPLALKFGADLVTDPSTDGGVTVGAVADGSLGAGATSLRGLSPVGQAWNISFFSENNGQNEALTPPGPVTVSFTLPAGLDPQQTASVALYVYDAGKGNWSFLGGSGSTLQVNGGGEYALMAYSQSFSDVPAGYWAAGDISLLAARHVVQGEGNGSFRPDRPVTRAEFAVMLQKILGIAPGPQPSPFVDAGGGWYAESVAALARAGIVTGDGGRFYPDREITREEMAAMLVRALPESGVTGAPAFNDAADISAWAKGAVTEAVRLQLVSGEPGGLFSPRADATRAEAVVMLERLLRLEGKM